MPLRVGIDMDGVLADFRSAFTRVSRSGRVAAEPGKSFGLSDSELRQAWKEVGAVHNWWTTLEPYEPAQIARLYTLARSHRWEVFFLTKRPETEGDSVQMQTQSWLESHGYYMPAVLTVPGSRGEVANALRLDLVIDDLEMSCVEVVSASSAKALLMLRDASQAALRDHAMNRGIGVVSDFEEALNVMAQLQDLLQERRGRLTRLADWFPPAKRQGAPLPFNPREERPVPPDSAADAAGRRTTPES